MTVKNCLVTESQYLPPISWFVQTYTYPCIVLDEEERFVKATTRNRCHIAGANGPIMLSVPLVNGRDQKVPMKEVKVDISGHWQKNHWQSIRSGYGRAPFFIYYNDEFEKVFNHPFEYLVDFNFELLKACYQSLGLKKEMLRKTDGIVGEKIDPAIIKLPPYQQVFSERFGFTPNLSIIDLLFNLGPDAGKYLNSF